MTSPLLEGWPIVCASCWDDISRANGHLCCGGFRCAQCHKKHEAEDEETMLMLLGLDD